MKATSDDSEGDAGEEEEEEEGEKKAGEEKARKRAAERSTGAERKRQKVEKEVSRCYLKFEEELFVKVSRSQLLCVLASPGSAEKLQWRVLQHAEAAYDFQAPRGKEEGKGGPKADAPADCSNDSIQRIVLHCVQTP